MPRPDQRPFRALPQLEEERLSLETCTYCPKLCRGACPVSDALPKETLTPWGKMSMATFAASGDVAIDESVAELAWACSSCHGCREECDHHNPVAKTLVSARGAYVKNGSAPESVKEVIRNFGEHEAEMIHASQALHTQMKAGGKTELLIGCGYVQHLPKEAMDAVAVARAVVGENVSVSPGCCGLPLYYAGDLDAFRTHAQAFLARMSDEMLVVDPGCAMAVTKYAAEVGVKSEKRVSMLVERAAAKLEAFGSVPGKVRFHDPCQLSRGLGITAEPRAILAHITGTAPTEFIKNRDKTRCSGGGGLLPVTFPDAAKIIGEERTGELAPDETLITACASSVRQFRRSHSNVSDLVTWMARALPR